MCSPDLDFLSAVESRPCYSGTGNALPFAIVYVQPLRKKSFSCRCLGHVSTMLTKIWAVLIGVDGYDHGGIPPLQGCVNDVLDVQAYLQRNHKVPTDQITTLISPRRELRQKYSSLGNLPTHKNIVRALEDVTARSSENDFIHVHFSGHGKRFPTMFSNQDPKKPATGYDEGILPSDFNCWGPDGLVPPLLDSEIGGLLEAMKGRLLFIVLDCCHSGGMTRGEEHATESCLVRCPDHRYGSSSNGPSSGPDGYRSPWNPENEPLRHSNPTDSWWYRVQDYTVLAACQPNELASEHLSGASRHNGRLTHFMLEVLNSEDPRNCTLTFRALHRQICTSFPHEKRQNPMLCGIDDRCLFGSKKVESDYDGIVTVVDSDRISINLGAAHGVRVGDEYGVFPRNAPLILSSGDLFREAKLSELGRASVKSVNGLGAKAFLQSRSPEVVVGCRIRLHSRQRDATVYIRLITSRLSEEHRQALKLVKQCWEGSRFPAAIIEAETPAATFQVGVTSVGSYEIQGSDGQALPSIPELPVGGPVRAKRVVMILRHLVKYHWVSCLRHNSSQLSSHFQFSVAALRRDGGYWTVKEGDSISVHFKNQFPRPPKPGTNTNSLYANIFNLTPAWGIAPLILGRLVEPGAELEPYSAEMEIPGMATLNQLSRVQDTIKVIVTTTPTHDTLNILGLKDLDAEGDLWRDTSEVPNEDDMNGMAGDNEGTQMLNQLVAESEASDLDRNLKRAYSETKLDDWQTAQDVVVTKRIDAS